MQSDGKTKYNQQTQVDLMNLVWNGGNPHHVVKGVHYEYAFKRNG